MRHHYSHSLALTFTTLPHHLYSFALTTRPHHSCSLVLTLSPHPRPSHSLALALLTRRHPSHASVPSISSMSRKMEQYQCITAAEVHPNYIAKSTHHRTLRVNYTVPHSRSALTTSEAKSNRAISHHHNERLLWIANSKYKCNSGAYLGKPRKSSDSACALMGGERYSALARGERGFPRGALAPHE